MGLIDLILPMEEIFTLVIIVVLCSVLVAGIKYIKTSGAKALFIIVVGTIIAFLVMRLI